MREGVKDISTPAASRRNESIDVLKGMAMICIIMIHMRTEAFLGYSVLMLFYYAVPLYFLISGYLLSDSVQRTGFGHFLWKRTKSLLVPYILFFGISYLWMNTVQALSTGGRVFGFEYTWAELSSAFFFAGKYLNNIAVVPPPLWFLHALFFISIVFYFLAKIRNIPVLVVLAVLLAGAAIPLQGFLKDSPLWLLRMLPVALFFMLCGCVLKRAQSKMAAKRAQEPEKTGQESPGRHLMYSFSVLPLFWAALRLMQLGRGDMWEISSGWYYLGALVFSLASFLLARETSSKMLAFVGRNSLYYLVIHPIILILPLMDELPEFFADRGFDGVAVFFCYFVVSFLIVSVFVFTIVSAKDRVASVMKDRKTKQKI